MTAKHSRMWGMWARVVVFASLGGAYLLRTLLPLTWVAAAGVILGFLMGRYVDPALDKANGSTMEQELGFIGFIMAQYWVIYAVVVRVLSVLIGLDQLRPRDTGSIISRSIIPGTLLRLVFADVPLYFAVWLASIIFNFAMPQGPWLTPLLAGQFLGLGLSDIIHLVIRGKNGREPEPRATRAGTGRDRSIPGRGPRER